MAKKDKKKMVLGILGFKRKTFPLSRRLQSSHMSASELVVTYSSVFQCCADKTDAFSLRAVEVTEFKLPHFLGVAWTGFLTSPDLSYFICKMRMIKGPNS